MRVLVDTSVWIDHLRYGNDRLCRLLEEGSVLCHPFVMGELACGTLTKRNEILGLLQALPETHLAQHQEVMQLVADRELSGRGLGWIDMHLLASALLTNCALWTLDKALEAVAVTLKEAK